jgi:hypothetical protein
MDICAKKGHEFQRFDDRQVFCARCGDFRTAPAIPYTVSVVPWYPAWWQPYPHYPTFIWSGSTTIGSIETGSSVYFDNTDAQVTYTVLS